MSDIAAHLVDDVLPEVPIRQCVCTLPWRLRSALDYDRKLCADVLAAFIGALKRSLRWRAKREFGLRSVRDAQVGALTFVQRADSALRLNVHFHTLAVDGVYVRDEAGELKFRELAEPMAEDIAQVAKWTHAALILVLKRYRRSIDGIETETDTFTSDQPVLASCYGASAADVQLLGAGGSQDRKARASPSPRARTRAGRGRGSRRGQHPRGGRRGRPRSKATRTPVPVHCSATAFPRAS